MWQRHGGRRFTFLPVSLGMLMIASLSSSAAGQDTVELPSPKQKSDLSIEQALRSRRSVRNFGIAPLTLKQVSQLLWSAQGVTNEKGYRTAPSAGATFPLEVFVVASKVEGLSAGVYRYDPHQHRLARTVDRNVRRQMGRAAGQNVVRDGVAVIVIAADYGRTTPRYGERGIRYVHMEAGHAAQNVYLQAQSLGLGTVAVGAFNDEHVKTVLELREKETPLYLMPVGWPE